MNSLSYFSERLSELMFSKEMTMDRLSVLIGVNSSTICLWLSGKRDIRLSNAVKLCEYFQCSLEFLFGRSEKLLDFTPKPALPFYIGLRDTMKMRGKTRYRIVNDLKKSHGHFDRWKAGGDPSMQIVIELADYLDVSLDYLAGRDR